MEQPAKVVESRYSTPSQQLLSLFPLFTVLVQVAPDMAWFIKRVAGGAASSWQDKVRQLSACVCVDVYIFLLSASRRSFKPFSFSFTLMFPLVSSLSLLPFPPPFACFTDVCGWKSWIKSSRRWCFPHGCRVWCRPSCKPPTNLTILFPFFLNEEEGRGGG